MKKQLTSFELSSDWPKLMVKSIRNRAGSILDGFHMWKRKSSVNLYSDDMFSTYAQKTYMENIPCELAFTHFIHVIHLRLINFETLSHGRIVGRMAFIYEYFL